MKNVLICLFVLSVVFLFVFVDFVNAARQVFSLELDDLSLSNSSVQFAIQDVNIAEANVPTKDDTFEEVRYSDSYSYTACNFL